MGTVPRKMGTVPRKMSESLREVSTKLVAVEWAIPWYGVEAANVMFWMAIAPFWIALKRRASKGNLYNKL